MAIIGDSTVSTYRENEANRGWGQMIPYFFEGHVRFENHAKPGRSTKTFIGEGLWAKVLESLGEEDFVLIQFGHNDSHEPGNPESTDASGDYRKFIEQYIEETRAKGATPILVTPMHRRSFDGKGNLLPFLVGDDGTPRYDLEPYAEAMRDVAKSKGVTLIDLFAMSGEFMQGIGNDALVDLLAPNDTTHWNKSGAIHMAALVCRGLAESDSPLKQHLLPNAGSAALAPETPIKPAGAPAVSGTAGSERDFALVEAGKAATIVYSGEDAKVVEIASELFAEDVERVSGVRPEVTTTAAGQSGPLVVIGTLGESPVIDALAAGRKIDVSGIKGGWERYRIEVVENPSPDVPQALVIAGSDRRGTAFGVFSLSEAIGVSPWYWWADVPAKRTDEIHISPEPFTSKEPSIRYRGIFINDEDWGLQEWAEKNFESGQGEVKDMGPKTYAKIFELLLRLKANHCWPAMHPSTKAFNHYPENKQVADDYAIVMGSSHCEPMLRNNVDEWDHKKFGDWNPVTNLPSMLDYWETRVAENAEFENVYTVGVRGVHDSGVPGGGSPKEKRDRLEKLIGLQRKMIEEHVNPDASKVPQSFVPYKEVLDLYQMGMDLPEDITLVWPDDNHGYIRQLPDAEERQRSGGSGVYYHLSYWGGSHDFLWLDSTPPAHLWLEMTKAYQLGVHEMWVLNVGDIKPMETGMGITFDLAWNIDAYGPDVQGRFLHDFYKQQFGPAFGEVIASLKDEYYRLCAIRRPEHMGFNQIYPNTPIQDSPWPMEKQQRVLQRWLRLAERTEAFAAELPEELRSSYFQLVEYPTLGAAAMAEKILRAEAARRTGSSDEGNLAVKAFERIKELTEEYNSLQGGKWREMMDYRPRGLPVFDMPSTAPTGTNPASPDPEEDVIRIDPTSFVRTRGQDGADWGVIDGLSPRGHAITVMPFQDVPTLRTAGAVRKHAPVAEYIFDSEQSSEVSVEIEALPTHPFTPEHEVLAAVSINDGAPVLVSFGERDSGGHDKLWAKNVLRHVMSGSAKLKVPKGRATLKLWSADRALVVQGIAIKPGK